MGLNESEFRALNPRGPADAANEADPVIPIRLFDDYRNEVLGSHRASGSANVYTAQGSNLLTATAIGSTTAAAGTNIDFPRNLAYEINISADATGMVASGTLSVAGWDMASVAITETVALTDVASVGSASYVRGTKVFARLSASALTVSGYELAAGSSTRSNSISLYVGEGNIIGIHQSIRSTNAIPWAWIGTAIQVGSFTVQTGDVGTAGISMSNAVASGTPVRVLRYLSR